MMLEARNLTLAGRLGGISTSLVPGTVTAICGPNGAGKSSLLAALASLLPVDGGTVMLDGEDIAAMHPRERARSIGYLPQDGEVAWDVAIRNLVALGRLPHRDAGDEVIERVLAALDLEALAERPVSAVSGGERARALLARVLAGEPRWILADEPLAALDLAHQANLVAHLRRVARAGTGVVLVLHDLALARNHADRVIVLDAGRLVEDSPAQQALSPERIEQVWQVRAQWIGQPGRQALVCEP